MSEEAAGLVISHGAMADGLVDAVRRIAGVPPDALIPITNEGKGRDELCSEILAAISSPRAVLFTDLPNGSCYLAATLVARQREGTRLVTGVNLPMLLDFIFNRGLDFSELVPRLADKGRSAIDGDRPHPG